MTVLDNSPKQLEHDRLAAEREELVIATIKHVQFSTISIIPKTPALDTTNTDIDWEIEKSVLIFFEDNF